MRGLRQWAAAAAALLASCAGGIGYGAPPLGTLEAICGTHAEYGADAPAVYSAFLDGYVAYRHKRVPKEEYCAFQASIARYHGALATGGAASRAQWAAFFNEARAQAISWRASVDPTLRGG